MRSGPLGQPPTLGFQNLPRDLPQPLSSGIPSQHQGNASGGDGFSNGGFVQSPRGAGSLPPTPGQVAPLAATGMGGSQTSMATLTQPALSHLGLRRSFGEIDAPKPEYCEACGNLLLVDSVYCRKCGRPRPMARNPSEAAPSMKNVQSSMPGFDDISALSSIAIAPRPPHHDSRGHFQMHSGKGVGNSRGSQVPVGGQQVGHPPPLGLSPSPIPPAFSPIPPSPTALAPHLGAMDTMGMTPCPPHLVPIEQANAMLLAVTSEYENILNIQRDQNHFAQRHRDAEVGHLRQCIDVLERDRVDEDSISALLNAKEEEVGIGLEEKRREVELLSNLLRMRDAQIAHLQTLNEMKAVQIRHFSATPPPPVVSAPSARSRQNEEQAQRRQRDELAEALEVAARLRMEKAELEQLVVAKERQLGLVQSVDPSLSDTSALQLGAQAIQMFHDSMRMRAENARSEDQAEELRVEVDRLRSHVEYLEGDIEEKREELRELSSALSTKMKRVIDLEAEVEELRREQRNNTKDAVDQIEKLQAGLLESQEAERLKQGFADQLQQELQDKNQRMLQQQTEFMQCKENAKHLEEKLQRTGGQLAEAEEALAQMLRNTTYKDRLVREMTEQVNISETKLHAYQINEVLGTRQRQLEQRAKETDLSQSLREKEALVGKLSSELAETRVKAGRDSRDNDLSAYPTSSVGGLVGSSRGNAGLGISGIAPLRRSSSSGGLLGTSSAFGRSAHAQPRLELDMTGTSHWMIEPGAAADSEQNSPRASSRGLSASPTPNSFFSQQVSHCYGVPRIQTSPPFLNGSGLDDTSVRVVNVRRPSGGHDFGYALTTPITGHVAAPPSFQNLLPPLPSFNGADPSSNALVAQYLPQPGDALDTKVAEFVNQPHNSHCKALFCRLSEGAYLFGTHRTQLRISPHGEQLEAFEENTWIAIAEFVRRKTTSQMIHLQRACAEVGNLNGAPSIGGT